MAVDRDALDARLRDLDGYVGMHAGGVRLQAVSEDGAVTLEYTGMCTGCPYRPVTMAATIRPALMEVPGVSSVEAVGSRISAVAERRMAAQFAGARTGIPRWVSANDLPVRSSAG